MNFDPVGIDSKGRYYMKFRIPFNNVEKIQSLQRWILVNSYTYYELDDIIVPDYKYDANAHQLMDLIREFPEDAKRSRYYKYFYDYTGDTGYHLVARVKKDDPELYRHIEMDANCALSFVRGRKPVPDHQKTIDLAIENNITYHEAVELECKLDRESRGVN